MEAVEKQFFDIYIHDVKYTINIKDVTPETTLNQFIRKTLGLTGTKVMCREGGCGVCVLAVIIERPNKNPVTVAVNSCLVSVYSCQNWKIMTVEGIGNRKTNFHKIQSTLANFNGTQCGFCSSGMVMNMYSLTRKDEKLNMKEIENSFGGNICRCTGYRPILAAFKQFASDFDEKNIGMVDDIEDLKQCKKEFCEKTCKSPCNVINPIKYLLSKGTWYQVNTIKEIFNVFVSNPNKDCRLVAGNTAHGIYKTFATADIYIDVANVEELLFHEMNTKNFIIGGGVTLADAIKFLKIASENDANYKYFSKIVDHLELVAHVPVRNIGTLAGNLSIKHKYNEFPSDIFLILETVKATITIVDQNERETNLTPEKYLKFDMDKKVIKTISLPALDSNYKYESYKIMPRAQNALAIVNSGFLFKFDKKNHVSECRIIYGGINPHFVHASQAEAYIVGQNLFDNLIMQKLFKILESELKPVHVLPNYSPDYRIQLAIALCYKFILSIAPKVTEENKSGGLKLERPLSVGTQDFTTKKSLYPLTEPIIKIEALAQCSGEAKYIIDIPDCPNQTFGAFVVANAPATSTITHVNIDNAKKLLGFIAYVDKNDVKGSNYFTDDNKEDEIFCSGIVKYYHQPIGLVVAASQDIAEKCAALVKVTCSLPKRKSSLTIQSAIKTNQAFQDDVIKPTSSGNNIKKTITGKLNLDMQYHHHMETQICNATPVENGQFDLFVGTQFMDMIQRVGAACLGIHQSKLNIYVRRLGGAFGAKGSRSGLVACAALIACNKLQKPVKLWMPFTHNMNIIGMRNSNYLEFTNKVDDKGVIQSLNMKTYTDYGIHRFEIATKIMKYLLLDTYKSDTFSIVINHTITDKPGSSWARAPGSTEAVAMMESIMEQTAYELNVDPLDLRLANITDAHLIKYVNDLKEWANVNQIKTDNALFNKKNRWRKRGMSVVPMAYKLDFPGTWTAILSVYQGDGTISISHPGIEMGQGINTKAVQVVAFYLEVETDKISCKPSHSLISPSSFQSAGSFSSESICLALKMCCEVLLKRMDDIKKKNPKATWAELVKLCYRAGVNLCVSQMTNNDINKPYTMYGVCASEVEIDILTGNFNVTRVHLLEDVGDSMSPLIDIGQVEGAFIMGLGYFTCERVVMDPSTGEMKTNRTINYQTPGAKDIPIEFNVKFPANNPNVASPFKTKSTGEPPFCLSVSVPLAIRDAIKSARLNSDKSIYGWYPIDGPSTVENNFMNSSNIYKQYTL